MASRPLINTTGQDSGQDLEPGLGQVETLNWIQDLVREELDDDSVLLSMDTEFGDVPGWDSLAHVSIIVAVEKKLGRKFVADDIEALAVVGDLVGLAETSAE